MKASVYQSKVLDGVSIRYYPNGGTFVKDNQDVSLGELTDNELTKTKLRLEMYSCLGWDYYNNLIKHPGMYYPEIQTTVESLYYLAQIPVQTGVYSKFRLTFNNPLELTVYCRSPKDARELGNKIARAINAVFKEAINELQNSFEAYTQLPYEVHNQILEWSVCYNVDWNSYSKDDKETTIGEKATGNYIKIRGTPKQYKIRLFKGLGLDNPVRIFKKRF